MIRQIETTSADRQRIRRDLAAIALVLAMFLAALIAMGVNHARAEASYAECQGWAVQQRVANVQLNLDSCDAERITGAAAWLGHKLPR